MIIKNNKRIIKMNAKQQLAYNLNTIIDMYMDNNNIKRFYKKVTKLNKCIYNNTNNDLFKDYKYYIYKVYDNIINGEEDITLINDCVYIIRKIILGLLYFE